MILAASWAPLAVVLVLAYLMRRQDRHARREGAGALVLEYGARFRMLSLAVGAVWTALFVFLFIASPPKPDDVPAVLLLIALATGTVVPYVMTVYGVSYRVTDDRLEKRSPWSHNFSVSWSEVRRVSYSKTLNQFVFDTTAGRARVGRYLNGLSDLRGTLERHVADAIWSDAKRFFPRI